MLAQKVVSGFLFGILALGGSYAAAGETQPSRQEDWERIVTAAKREGEIVFYGSSGYELVFQEFHKRFPEIKVKSLTGLSGSEYAQRIMTERRAGKFAVDIMLTGIVTPSRVLYRAKILDPIRPELVLPEVVDGSKWWAGKHHYADPEGQYIFVFQGNVHGGENAYNTRLVNPGELTSYWDFLGPKWRGKIVAYDPKRVSTVAHSLRFFYNHPDLGPEFIRRFFGEMELVVSRDNRQMLDWLAVGKYPVAFFISGVEDLIKQGLPVKMFSPNSFKEGAFVGPTQGSVSLLNRAPHPNAAKVALNWLLSREGQIAYQTSGDIRDSMREDISKEIIPLDHRRIKGVKYIYSGRPDWVDMEPVNKIVSEVLGKR